MLWTSTVWTWIQAENNHRWEAHNGMEKSSWWLCLTVSPKVSAPGKRHWYFWHEFWSEDMREALSMFTDFQNPKTIVEEYIENCGHICLFLPKYHCELNPIECVWCKAKKFTRAHCTYTLPALRRVIPESLATVTIDDIRKYSTKARDYKKAYGDEKIGAAVEEAVKIYKSHRRVNFDSSAT